jgi:hypothetical protein
MSAWPAQIHFFVAGKINEDRKELKKDKALLKARTKETRWCDLFLLSEAQSYIERIFDQTS